VSKSWNFWGSKKLPAWKLFSAPDKKKSMRQIIKIRIKDSKKAPEKVRIQAGLKKPLEHL
jgi:hypothetical protein